MASKYEFKTATFEDGTCAVLRADPAKPHLLDVIATFHDVERARDYVRSENNPSGARHEQRPVLKQALRANPKQVSKSKPIPAAEATKPRQAVAVKPKHASVTETKPASAAEPKQASAVAPKQAIEIKPKPASKPKPAPVAADITERQQAVFNALRSLMDKKNLVEVRGAELAKVSSIPSGSLHSVLVSLEKKGMIRTERRGSANFRAIYEVLKTPGKTSRSMNGAHGKEPHSETSAR